MTFAFYNDLTKGSEVRFMRKILLVDDNSAIAQELAKLYGDSFTDFILKCGAFSAIVN